MLRPHFSKSERLEVVFVPDNYINVTVNSK
jgi:hypothetical protein